MTSEFRDDPIAMVTTRVLWIYAHEFVIRKLLNINRPNVGEKKKKKLSTEESIPTRVQKYEHISFFNNSLKHLQSISPSTILSLT